MQIDFKFPHNAVFIIIPILLLIAMSFGLRKKIRILQKLQLALIIKGERLRILCMFLGLILICVSLLGPQQLIGKTTIKQEGLDIYILMDTSKSMLVQDVAPSRLEREKQIIGQILSKLEGDRIGFIPYATSAYIQMPLTDDYDLANLFLKVVDTDMIGGGGSDVGKAIKLAHDSFDRSSQGNQVILIISDGEEHEKNSAEVLKNEMEASLKVYTIGIGTPSGGLIPVYEDNSDQIIDYKTDEEGNPVMSKLEDTTLKELAQIGKGQYYLASVNGSEVTDFLSDISTLKKGSSKTQEVNRYGQLYQYFLGAGMVVFLVGYLVPFRRKSL
ncbi:MAG: VWA domain-containing protein [Vallitaleaceae bacterium]|nr:VWA domain-containing protein [Vallitaleaceae bacterium]